MATQKRKGLTYAQVATKWQDAVNQLCAAKSRIAELEKEYADLKAEYELIWALDSNARIRELEKQVAFLEDRDELVADLDHANAECDRLRDECCILLKSNKYWRDLMKEKCGIK